MTKKEPIIIFILAVLVLAAAGFIWDQYRELTDLRIANENNKVAIDVLENEKKNLESQTAELNVKLDTLESEIKGYLKAEGKITILGKNCEDEFEFCLIELIKKLTNTSGIDCSGSIVDGSCPLWCAAGSDADCCAQKTGYMWIQGKGCYDISKI